MRSWRICWAWNKESHSAIRPCCGWIEPVQDKICDSEAERLNCDE